jgi:hypothetical protein
MALTKGSFGQSPLGYFTYTGWVIIATLAVTGWVRHRLGDYGWMFTWQLLTVAAMTVAYISYVLFRDRLQDKAFRLNFSRRARIQLGLHPRLRSWKLWLAAMPGARHITWLRGCLGKWLAWLGAFPGRSGVQHRLGWLALLLRKGSVLLPGVAYCSVAFALMWFDNRRFVLVIALIETVAICSLRPKFDFATRIWLFALSIATWGLTSGLTFTHLADWLLNGDASTGLSALAFIIVFGVVLAELSDDGPAHKTPVVAGLVTVAALGCFCAYALRTDHFLVDWVPIHRSYFADIAQSVRDGHWLLWDVPSLYGFLSILSLAIVPAPNAWQALYELTAFFLVVQATIVFAILRWGRAGWSNAIFAIAFPLAITGDSLTRYIWNGRLYPQGGLRFFWTIDLLLVAFLSYVWREHRSRVTALRYAGHALWFFAVLWSFENAVWDSIVWFAFLAVDAFVSAPEPTPRAGLMRFLRHSWPIVALPVLGFAIIESVYLVALGHSPDWRGYLEFTALFTSGSIRPIFHVQWLGAGWSIVIVLGALGTLGIGIVRLRRFEALPLVSAAWLAVWVTASYYAVEPLDLYVALLMAVMAPAIAIGIFLSRDILKEDESAWFARLSFAPLAIVAIAFAVGEPSRLAQMKLPFTPGWQFNVTNSFPTISGELAGLMTAAKIAPTDRVLFPTGPFWTELDQGLILPFTHLADGSTVEYHSWLPTSPAGPEELINGLSPARRNLYVARYLMQARSAGWFIAYRERAACESLAPGLSTVRTLSSTNFSASLCAFSRPQEVSRSFPVLPATGSTTF